MNVELSYEQSARIELLALVAGKPASEMLLEAAISLLDRDAGCCERCRPATPQEFLDEEQVEARFAQLLRR